MKPEEAGRLLGVEPPNLAGCRSFHEAEERLAAWVEGTVRKAWKREVRKAHPDLATSEEDRLDREAKTKRLNRAREVLGEVRVVPARPRSRTRVTIIQTGTGFSTGSTTSSATTGGAYPWNF